MTIKRARQILGKDADGITDAELEKEIKTAEVLKNLYLQKIVKKFPCKGSLKPNKYDKA